MMSQTVSVVIPVYNGAHYLRAGLEHLRASTDPPLECIVVDDGSTDNSAQIARECGATVISSPHCGPSTARNLGASAASGDILLFIDADVCVHPDTISRVLWNFETDPALDALIGSYDDSPGSEDFISQYRNLMHCFVHQYGRREACAFWSGCGAIRRHVFLTYSGFDQSYLAMEDIELGYRLVHAGRKVILDKHLLVKHLKRWTFLHVLKTDMLLRGIPWTELILRDRRMPNDLNVQISDRISVALVFILFGFAAEGTLRYGGYFLTPLVAILIFMLATYWVGSPARPPSKGVTSFMAAVVAGFIWLAYAHRMLPLVPPLLLGYALLFLRGRYVHDNETRHYLTGLAYVAYLLVAILFTLTFLPHRPFVFGIYAVLVSMIAINRNFYLFFGSKRGRITALAVIPLHFLYHFYNGISFIVGSIRYLWKALTRRQRFSWLSLLVLVALSVGLSSCGHPARVRSNDVHAATDPNNPATKLPRYLRALQTRASFLMFTAHPDDEDGATLVYETQGEGARGALFTITRGEGGQNVMSADLGDSLGLIRTQELLRSDQYYGVDQYFSRLIDYGFSKSSEEANEKWGHDRLLSDAVRVIRTVRPLVIISEFLGTPIDGHGHHQVSGRIAREAFVAAGDPAKFPEQIHEGLRPWSPLKLYARVPRVPLTAQGIFGYLRMNFVHSENLPATTLQIHESEHAPESSSTYSEIARAALSYQKTQGGAGR
ncbi:MAG: glycosyltransferase, partial [Bryobacterales bacterium]|nr:glycosyltransferase [Bryobacterales bacterium]